VLTQSIQGDTGGSLIVRDALDAAGCRTDIDVAEMDNYLYSCWRLSPMRIRPIVRKRRLQIATFPGSRIGAVFPRVSPLFPEAVAALEYPVRRLHQRQCDAACGELRGQRGAYRERKRLQILCRRRDTGGRPAI
jgi:hypothetical protein